MAVTARSTANRWSLFMPAHSVRRSASLHPRGTVNVFARPAADSALPPPAPCDEHSGEPLPGSWLFLRGAPGAQAEVMPRACQLSSAARRSSEADGAVHVCPLPPPRAAAGAAAAAAAAAEDALVGSGVRNEGGARLTTRLRSLTASSASMRISRATAAEGPTAWETPEAAAADCA